MCVFLLALAATPARAGSADQGVVFVAEQAADKDDFGLVVDIDQSLIAVGSRQSDPRFDDRGIVYIFENTPAGITRLASLVPQDNPAWFGSDIALSGQVLLAGAPGAQFREGAAYLFERQDDAWVEVATLRRKADVRKEKGFFGSAVGLDGDLAVIGAPGVDAFGEDAGIAMIYKRHDGSWTPTATLKPDQAGERFGTSVAIEGNRVLIGAPGDEHESVGHAYLFERTAKGWQRIARLSAAAGTGGNAFGYAVALNNDRALVGARYADSIEPKTGAAYVFEPLDDGWAQVAKL
ncbi:MAG: hypothetical protein ABF296_04345, partial [Oceanococcaceae bacterium]